MASYLPTPEGREEPLLVRGSSGELELMRDSFSELCAQHELQNRHVIVLAVVGEFRRGKSFFLNLIIKYLANQGIEGWMDRKVDFKGFKSRAGLKGTTEGIVMWSKAFPIGQTHAVILLDTEGLHDERATERGMSHVFATSALVSSLQIFNIFDRINRSTMMEAQSFAEFGRLVQSSTQQRAFQDVLFLVRDWQNEIELPYGMEGGQKHLDHWLHNQEGARDSLGVCYERTWAFLTPVPSEKVKKSNQFTGTSTEMGEDFAEHMRSLIEKLFSPGLLSPLKVDGAPLLLREFPAHFATVAESLIKSNLQPQSMFQAQVELTSVRAVNAALTSYNQGMYNTMQRTEEPPSNLSEVHDTFSQAALEMFDKALKFGNQSETQKYREKLEADLREAYGRYTEMHAVRLQSVVMQRDYEIERLDREYQLKMTKLQEKMALKKQKLENQHAKDMEILKTNLKQANEKEIQRKEREITEKYEKKINKLEDKHKTEIQKLKEKFESARPKSKIESVLQTIGAAAGTFMREFLRK